MKKCILLVAFIVAFLAGGALAQEIGQGTLTGQIVNSTGIPLSNCVVVVFDSKKGPPPAPEQYWRVPDYGSKIGGDGRFQIAVAPGVYYLGIVRLLSGTDGQPRLEDWLYIGRDEAGKLRSYAMEPGKVTDLGVLRQMNFLSSSKKDDNYPSIEGVVADKTGNPIKNAIVEAYAVEAYGKQPLFSSGKTEGDGKYSMGVYEGSYYLKVRARYPSDVTGVAPVRPNRGLPVYYDLEEAVIVTVKAREGKKEVNVTVKALSGRAPLKK